MAGEKEMFVGSDFSFNFNGVMRNLGSFRVTGDDETATAKPLERPITLKRTTAKNTKIICSGMESTVTGGGTYKAIMTAWMKSTPPTAVSWNNKAATPESQLPDDYFDDDYYPLASWRITNVSGGPTGQNDTVMWEATIEPGY